MRNLQYAIILQEFEEGGRTKVCAYHPDLGEDTCYYIGSSVSEVLAGLAFRKEEIIKYYEDSGTALPEPINYSNYMVDLLEDDFSFVCVACGKVIDDFDLDVDDDLDDACFYCKTCSEGLKV